MNVHKNISRKKRLFCSVNIDANSADLWPSLSQGTSTK